MKIQVILAFDLEFEDGSPVKKRCDLVRAGNDACHAIRTRLMGEGFLGHRLLIGTYCLTASVVDGEILDSVEPR